MSEVFELNVSKNSGTDNQRSLSFNTNDLARMVLVLGLLTQC